MAAVASGGVQTSRISDDTVFYSLYPDSSLSKSPSSTASTTLLDEEFSALHHQILNSIAPFISDYIWQHEPFHLSVSSDPIPHFHGKTRFGDNLEDEWFVVFLLFHVSRAFPSLSIQVFDSDGQFLLIEAAFSLPRWLNPETSENRVFIRNGALHTIPKKQFPSNPTLLEALKILSGGVHNTRASDSVQAAISRRVADYPERALRNTHRVTVQVPVSVAWVLKHEPCLISLAVEGFYDRDVDSMKFAAKMEKFLERGKEEMVRVSVRMSRAMYAQLVQQKFQAPKCYPMPKRADNMKGFLEAELGMKIACGFEMIYQMRKRTGSEGKGSTWEVYKKSLENSGYFKGLLPGSKEYRMLMENAEQYYRQGAAFSRTSELMSAPVRRIDEILSLPHSSNDFKDLEVPPSDDDGWLYNGESELNSALEERQKEMDLYESQCRNNQKSKEQNNSCPSSCSQLDDFNFGDIAKSMQAFVQKVSSFEGAEIPENRDSKEVDFDVEHFLKEMESVVGRMGEEASATRVGSDEGNSSASDMDFDDSDDESNVGDENMEDSFMDSYSNALNEELKPTSLHKSFVRANDEPSTIANKEQGTSAASNDIEEDFAPVDVDVNLVKSLLDSFSSQQGLPGPASNLLGLMGLQLPEDSNKGK
ncbi:protein ecdysoneless homolog [Aristolochia californica]|uniref:protein ecdysoneless homolog n=1 Tax=Aristolochia californica TaxID=171875 RepID=UPI0035E00228